MQWKILDSLLHADIPPPRLRVQRVRRITHLPPLADLPVAHLRNAFLRLGLRRARSFLGTGSHSQSGAPIQLAFVCLRRQSLGRTTRVAARVAAGRVMMKKTAA